LKPFLPSRARKGKLKSNKTKLYLVTYAYIKKENFVVKLLLMSDNSSLFCFSTGLSVTAWCDLRKEKQQRSYYQTILLPVSILPIKSLPHELLFVETTHHCGDSHPTPPFLLGRK